MQLGLEDYDPLERCFDNFHKNEPLVYILGFGVAECLTDIPGSSGVSVGKDRSCVTQKPVARAFLAPKLADAPLSPRPHFRFCRPGAWYVSGRIRRPEGLRLSPSLFSLVFRQHSRNMQVAEAFCLPGSETERCGSEDRCVRMSDRPGMPAPVRPVGQPACTRAAASSIAGGGILFR